MLNRLGALVGAEATQYGEFSLWEDGRSYSTDRSIESRGAPEWVSVNWHRLWQQDPISCHLNAGATKPLAISDRVRRRAFQRLEIFGLARACKHFFRSGRANQWRDVLSREQIGRIVEAQREQMARFRYVPTGY